MPRLWPWLALLLVAAPLGGFWLSGAAVVWDVPRAGRFNFSGGISVLPAFVALLAALTLYTAAFIAEIVRAGIQSVASGQAEAAAALGLAPGAVMRAVVLPQALRVIVPPLTSQYLNLIKNSSLGLVIGYPDLMATFGSTTLSQTGQAIETIFLVMVFYLAVSLLISVAMNLYNRAIRLKER
ncbi:MAG: ABC transporter permease subunit [Alphaproteobacteria bacterium]